MIIVQVITAFQFRGAEIAALQLSRELVAAGNVVHYVALYESEDKFLVPPELNGVCLKGRRNVVFDIGLLTRLVKLLRFINADIVQANAGDTLKYLAAARIFPGLKHKLIFRNASIVSRYLRSYSQRQFNGLLYKAVDKIFSVSLESRADLVGIFPKLRERTVVIRNGIAINREPPILSSQKTFDIIHVGGFSFEKNHAGLIRIFQKILKIKPESRLILVGNGPLYADTKQLVEHVGLTGKVDFIGVVSDVLSLVAASNVLVLPSIIEGLPGVILEAFLCCVPVVAYDVGGIAEVVINRETGFLISPGDEESFAEAVLEVMRTSQSNITARAFKLLVDEYDIAKLAKKVLDEYHLTIGHNSR